jgi:hypothetical protein
MGVHRPAGELSETSGGGSCPFLRLGCTEAFLEMLDQRSIAPRQTGLSYQLLQFAHISLGYFLERPLVGGIAEEDATPKRAAMSGRAEISHLIGAVVRVHENWAGWTFFEEQSCFLVAEKQGVAELLETATAPADPAGDPEVGQLLVELRVEPLQLFTEFGGH